MSEYIEFKIREEHLSEIVKELEKLKPPSRLKWLMIFFMMGVLGGMSIGAVLAVR
ncbi:MAG: hypothetical protein ACO2OR_04565 [Desulfurococcaceae archaeon]